MQNKKDLLLYFMLLTTLVIPILIGLYMQNFATWRFVSLPLHSFLEASGAMIAFILSGIIFVMYQDKLIFNHYHYTSFALICMGVFDGFHAMVYPGEIFVWLHSLAVFCGGILFAFVWIPQSSATKKQYVLFPIALFVFSFIIAMGSILYPQFIPQMLTSDGDFTKTANLLNIIGGSMFIMASLHFIKNYLDTSDFDSLLFAGHTMLFGSAGVLFFFSSVWDMQWWLWHFLRFFAYLVAIYFMMRTFYRFVFRLNQAKQKLQIQNDSLNQSVKLLAEYKKAIFEGSIISAADLQGNIIYVNEEFEKITGYTKEEIIGRPHSIFRHPQTPKSTFKDLWNTIENKKSWKGLIKNLRKDGSSFCAKMSVVPILDSNNEIMEYIALLEDVTELVDSQDELRKNFYTDRLTKLSNRYKLLDDLKNAKSANIAIVNIDNFKHINDFYGEDFGDKVLCNLSNRLLDLVYKFGFKTYRNHADEFSLVAYDPTNEDDFIENIKSILLNIENSILEVDEEDIHLGLTAGISIGKLDLQLADIALKEAKKRKKDYVVYSSQLNINEEYKNNLLWKKKIIEALNDDRIQVVFQPILDNNTQNINKFESLVRLIDNDGTIVSPFQFLDIAKHSKLYPQITKRVIEKVFKYINQTHNAISINITAEDILNQSTKEFIYNQLKESNRTNQIIFELVESEGIESFDEVKLFIEKIKSYGCKIAIDDFGTGYSNFEYLLKLEADIIKIDGSLIKHIDTNQNSKNVVESIVTFAKKNGIKTVAEFVSTQAILEKVQELDIDLSQGYYISQPKFWEDL